MFHGSNRENSSFVVTVSRYAVVLGSCGVALALRYLLDPALGDAYPFIFAFASVALSATLGGWRAGALAMALNYLVTDWYFIPPRNGFALGHGREGWVALASFTFTSGIITWLAHTMRRAEWEARQAAASRDAERERLRVTLYSIGDAVIATDAKGEVTYLNPIAEDLTGWRENEAIGRPLTEVFNIVNESTRERSSNPVEKALRTGRVVGLANHTILIARDGRERSISDSAAPIRDSLGSIVGVVLVFRDVTVERAAEHATARASEEQIVLTSALERLLSSRDPEALVADLCREVMAHIRADAFFHFRLNAAGDKLLLEASQGIPVSMLGEMQVLSTSEPICGALNDPSMRFALHEVQEDAFDRSPFLQRVGILAYVCFPLKSGEHLLGTLSFGSRTRERFTDYEIEFARSIAQHVALALDRLHHEQTLNVRERRLAEQARLLDLSNDGIIVCDWQDRIVYWNRGAEDIYGWSAKEAIGHFKYELLHTEFSVPREKVLQILQRENRWQGELTHLRRDGRRIVVMTRWALDRDPAGKPAFILKSDNDITAQKDAEEKLRKSQHQLRLVADHIPALVGYIDRNLVFRYVNAAYSDWFGREESELLGHHASEVIAPEIYEHRLPFIRAALRGEEVRFEGPANHRTRGVRQTEIVYIPERSEGEVQGFYVFVQDVTDRIAAQQVLEKQAVELLDAARRKDEFLAMLAHELRNPLASASSAAALLRASSDQESRDWSLDVINRQIGHLARLIDDLLDVSRITSGKIRLQKELVGIGSVLRRAEESAKALIEERGHKLITDYPRDPSELPIEADPTRLEQIVSNLLTNAAKYTEAGGTIWLSAQRDENAEGSEIVIRVRDTGIGIPPDRIDSMFELFAQGERSIARSEGGLGIGLTLVKKLAEMHGGSVRAYSEGVGKGSEFVVRVPVGAVPSPSAIANGAEWVAPESRPAAGSTVLVVDDNQDTAIGLERLLRIWGFHVEAAHNGEDALAMAQALAPNFVLLDIGLPGVDGYEVCRRLRAQPNCKDALIIAISGYGQDDDRRRSSEAGFDHHLIKPVNLEELRALLVARSASQVVC